MNRRAHLAVRAIAVLAVGAIAIVQASRPAPPATQVVSLAPSEPGIAQLAPLFGRQDTAPDANDQLVPELFGIAGRLPNDAEALVRTAAGTSERLRIGASAGGWTLVAITNDAVTFEREGVRKVVRLKPAP